MGNTGSNTARTVRIVVALLTIACFVIGGTLTGAYLALRHIVTTTSLEYAKALGVTLTPSEVRFGVDFVQLLDSRFVLLKVPGVTGTVRRVDADIDLWTLRPTRLFLSGVTVDAKGDPIVLEDSALRYWEQLRPKLPAGKPGSSMPMVEWRHLALNLTTGNALLPTVSVTELTIATGVGPTHDETAIRTATTKARGIDLGPLEIALRNQDGTLELGWGPTLLESKWRVAYRDLPGSAQVRLSFQPFPVPELLGRLGSPVPETLKTTKLSGHIETAHDKATGKTTGTSTLTLQGFAPPYPPELKGYRFADETSMRAQFEIDPLWLIAELRSIELRTGDLSLAGHGRIDRDLLSARLRAELTTTLDCVTLAKGWATEAVGGQLGQWGAKNAPKAVQGSVSVRVQVDADSNRLSEAKVAKRIGIGCGLRPMTLVDLLDLGLPPLPDRQTLERLVQLVPPSTVIANLGAMPQLLPPLGSLLAPPTAVAQPKPAATSGKKPRAGTASAPPPK